MQKNIKTYYKNCDSATATYRPLRGDYGIPNRPTTQAIDEIVKKFEETEVVTLHLSCRRPECIDSSSFSGIKDVLRLIMAYFRFRSTHTSI